MVAKTTLFYTLRYGGIYLDQDVMTINNLFDQNNYLKYGEYKGIIEADKIKKSFLVAQKSECRKQPNCVNNAIMGFPAKDAFLMDAMEEMV